ncbi:oligosaccharide flippase family protein [Kocuria sediminis]|uniref:oligosaccharide flippase family protein n=1 Tax=Kocuria sediminis TaxID=1038857 RepID=UPI0013907550
MRTLLGASAHVGALTAANVLHLCTLLISTILLGRSAGPEALGIFSLATASGSILQSISTAGLHTAAIAALLRADINRTSELRRIIFSRIFVIPPIFVCGALIVHLLPGIELADPKVMTLFFIGYAVGSFDIADLSHTALGNFQTIAWRRVALLICFCPFIFLAASRGHLESVLLLLAVESVLWQLVLIPGAGLPAWPFRHIPNEWKATIRGIWGVRSLWIASILGSIAQRIDLFIVGGLMTTYAAGQYATASRPVEATTMVAGSLITVLFNAMARNRNSASAYARYSARAARALTFASASITITILLFGPMAIIYLYGDAFYPAAQLLLIYAASIVFIFQKQLLDRIVILEGSYNYTFLYSCAFIAITVMLNLIFIPLYELTGAAVASVLTHPVALISTFAFTARGRQMLAIGYGSVVLPWSRFTPSANNLINTR